MKTQIHVHLKSGISYLADPTIETMDEAEWWIADMMNDPEGGLPTLRLLLTSESGGGTAIIRVDAIDSIVVTEVE